LVKDGDYVEKDQALLRLTLMKATLELPAEARDYHIGRVAAEQ
jgi:biotin carboxyl carrier protein